MEFDWDEIFNLGMVLLCVVCAALAAGLTMGLLSLAPRNLQVKAMIGEDEEAKAAESVLPLVRNHHLLLVTLLLFNAVANEALPVFLEKVVPKFAAVLISVSLVLVFGEVNQHSLMHIQIYLTRRNLHRLYHPLYLQVRIN